MKIAIIDADLIGRSKHRFPNLACEKISGYYLDKGHYVVLKTDYEGLDYFDKVFISKVFTDTPLPEEVLRLPNVEYGGTGFYFDKAPNLPDEIEHYMPDYHLYDNWIKDQINSGLRAKEFKEYTDYSIGFLTRGCFRKCPFCVNQKYDRVFKHSPLEEFYDPTRKKICLLDDNILGCPEWKTLIQSLINTGKPFRFKQGLDERLLTDEKCELLFNSKYDSTFIFAFDNIKDYELIKSKLEMIRRHTHKICKFYVLVGFTGIDKEDILNMFRRIELLLEYNCLPYIMRYQSKDDSPWKKSIYKSIYITVSAWCNQPSFLKSKTFKEFCELRKNTGLEALDLMDKDVEIKKYLDLRWNKNGIL